MLTTLLTCLNFCCRKEVRFISFAKKDAYNISQRLIPLQRHGTSTFRRACARVWMRAVQRSFVVGGVTPPNVIVGIVCQCSPTAAAAVV